MDGSDKVRKKATKKIDRSYGSREQKKYDVLAFFDRHLPERVGGGKLKTL